jgi:acetamidase/formamidase
MAPHHDIPPVPENMVWGYLDATVPPVLTIRSGDTIQLTAWSSADPEDLPPDRSVVDEGHLEALGRLERGPASHMITGPVFVEPAEPGDVLQVEILEVTLRDAWGFIGLLPGRGALPDEVDAPVVAHAAIDRGRQTARLPWGKDLSLAPFFGILAVAPPAAMGRCSTLPPGRFGGNMDNRELSAGATLYLPVFNRGALFYAGDGHAVQGDGEVCLTALETALTGTFRLSVRTDLGYRQPFAETLTSYIGIGLSEDLDEAAREAVREMIDHVCRRTSLSRQEAYMLCSLAGHLHVTQVVDGVKGCHMLLDKAAL